MAGAPVLTLANITLTNVAINEAPAVYTGSPDHAPPGYYAPKHGVLQVIGKVINNGGVIEAGRNNRIGGGSLDIVLERQTTFINKGIIETYADNQLTITGTDHSKLENDATINAFGGPVVISTHLTGVGTVNVENAGVGLESSVELSAAVDAGQTFHLYRGPLQLDAPASFLGQVSIDAQGGGSVRLEGLTAASWGAHADLVEFFDNAGKVVDTLRFTSPQDATTLAIYTTPDATYGSTINVVNAHPFGAPAGAFILPYHAIA